MPLTAEQRTDIDFRVDAVMVKFAALFDNAKEPTGEEVVGFIVANKNATYKYLIAAIAEFYRSRK